MSDVTNNRFYTRDEKKKAILDLLLSMLELESDVNNQSTHILRNLKENQEQPIMIKSRLYYILDENGKAVPTTDRLEWGRFLESDKRIVAHTVFGKLEASTIFLGVDHNYSNSGEPLLWETMIFRDGDQELLQRYSSKEAAEQGHLDAVVKIFIEQSYHPSMEK